MSPRNTTTGHVLEVMVVPALDRGGYQVSKQVPVGQRLGGGRHIVDAVAANDTERILVSLKWQQVGGTAEQKVPFEVICLAEALLTGEYSKAYLVLGGEGWTLRDFFTNDGLGRHLKNIEHVRIVTLENFIALANGGKL